MSKVGVVTDTINCLPPEVIKEYDIRIVPLLLSIDGKAYRDQVELAPDEFWKIFPEMKEFTTAAPSLGDFIEVFRGLAQSTDSIVCIFLLGIDGTHALRKTLRSHHPLYEVCEIRFGCSLGFQILLSFCVGISFFNQIVFVCDLVLLW